MPRSHRTLHKYFRLRVFLIYPICVVCGSKKNREVHHLNDASNHPRQRYDVKNGITLCRKHHVMFHTVFMYGFISLCTKKDFEDFMEMIEKLKEEFLIEVISNLQKGLKK